VEHDGDHEFHGRVFRIAAAIGMEHGAFVGLGIAAGVDEGVDAVPAVVGDHGDWRPGMEAVRAVAEFIEGDRRTVACEPSG
jgi:hypothetical protein